VGNGPRCIEDGSISNTTNYVTSKAREGGLPGRSVHFPATFRRKAGAGVACMVGPRDRTRLPISTAQDAQADVPQPGCRRVFWSVRVTTLQREARSRREDKAACGRGSD